MKGEFMNKIFLAALLTVLVLALAGTVMADEPYSFELTEAYTFAEETEHWSINVSLPQVSGMADEDEQAALNEYILSKKDLMIEDYEQNVVFAETAVEEGLDPHFSYTYSWDIVTDSDDYFVFRISWFFAAGSSTTLNEYFNLDKNTGKLLDFDEDAVTSLEQMAAVRGQIYDQMLAANEESQDEYGVNIYWIEDDTLDISLGQVRYLNHWYYNADGALVIAFDKYEVAPGVMGNPEFVVYPEGVPAE